MMNGGNVMAGGTVINIAVNNGQPVTPESAIPGPYASSVPSARRRQPAGQGGRCRSFEQSEAIWKAIHKLYGLLAQQDGRDRRLHRRAANNC